MGGEPARQSDGEAVRGCRMRGRGGGANGGLHEDHERNENEWRENVEQQPPGEAAEALVLEEDLWSGRAENPHEASKGRRGLMSCVGEGAAAMG